MDLQNAFSFKWANQRKVFGKRLIDQPVIRNKLGSMVSQLESVQNWLENITYQMCNMPYLEQSQKLAGPIALLKYQSTRVAHHVADEACQIFGGRALTKTGMGRSIESFQRTYKFAVSIQLALFLLIQCDMLNLLLFCRLFWVNV